MMISGGDLGRERKRSWEYPLAQGEKIERIVEAYEYERVNCEEALEVCEAELQEAETRENRCKIALESWVRTQQRVREGSEDYALLLEAFLLWNGRRVKVNQPSSFGLAKKGTLAQKQPRSGTASSACAAQEPASSSWLYQVSQSLGSVELWDAFYLLGGLLLGFLLRCAQYYGVKPDDFFGSSSFS